MPGLLGLLLSDPEPKEPTLVAVTRKCDGETLTTFDHAWLVEAIQHRDDLDQRLQTQHIFDVCRQLSIDIGRIGTPVD